MAVIIVLFAAVCMASAAPPAPPRLYHPHAPAQLQQINSLDYYLDNPEVQAYYNQQQQKQENEAADSNQPSRLETLEPDSEVELIPGAQQPQQPPQQAPVAPNIPGLLPGQRVFIVHMPVPGYRPGTIGGYQPVYVVAAGAQGNPGFPGNGYANPGYQNPGYQNPGYQNPGYQNPGYQNPGYQNPGYQNPGYQNTIYLDPVSGQVVSPLAYPRGVVQQGNGLLLGSPLNHPYNLLYQDPNLTYEKSTKNNDKTSSKFVRPKTGPGDGNGHENGNGHVNGNENGNGNLNLNLKNLNLKNLRNQNNNESRAVHLSQLVGLGQGGPDNNGAALSLIKSQALIESKEAEEQRQRPNAHAQARPKV